MVSSNPRRKITPDLQRVMLYVLIQMIHAEGLGAKSQRSYAKSLGVSVGQLSNAINAIMDALEDADVALDFPRDGGAPSLREMLFRYDHACRQLEAGADPDDMILRIDEVALRPKPGWEPFLRDLLPDVWNLPWAKEMWEHRKLEGWLMGRHGSEVATTQVALMVADSIFQELRVPHAELGWGCVPEELTAALPISLRSSLRVQDKLDEWMVDRDRNQGSRMLHEIINILAGGRTPVFSWNHCQWNIHRVRRQEGSWWLDTFNENGNVRAWDCRGLLDLKIHDISKIELPKGIVFKTQAASRSEFSCYPITVDRPGCCSLAFPRGETFLLDAAPSVTLSDLQRWINAREVDNILGRSGVPISWATFQIMPRYSLATADDPAWIEFCSRLMRYAGRVRLRTPGDSALERHPMLSWCTGELDSRLLGVL